MWAAYPPYPFAALRLGFRVLGKKGESVKARLISYLEVEERFTALLSELEQKPLDEETILDKGAELLFILGICVSQMNAPNSRYYPGKEEHLEKLEQASKAITYKLNTCTVEEISRQVPLAYKNLFGVH